MLRMDLIRLFLVLDDEVMVNGLDNQTEKRHGIRRFAGFVSR